jgi:polyphosphate kinase
VTEFFRNCPEMERAIIRSGVTLIKYWFEISEPEQKRRFLGRVEDGRKRWKLSDIDLESHRRWYDYSVARDEMFTRTDSNESPWFVVMADDKRRARLNCIAHLLSMIPYKRLPRERVKLPKRQPPPRGYRERPHRYRVVPERY